MPIQANDRGEVLSAQHANWVAARARLFAGPPPLPKIKRPRPVSPFASERTVSRMRRLFPRAIEEIDEYGNAVVPGFFMPGWKQIALEVAAKHQVSLTDLLSCRRNRQVVDARHEVFWRCKQETTLSLPQIGQRMGGKDHTTVLHGIRKHALKVAQEGAIG